MLFMKNKKGQTINLISGTVLAFMVMIFLVFAVLYGISALNPSSFFTTGSAEANATTKLVTNLTTGVSSFGDYIPKLFAVLGVVLILSAIVLLILYVKRMQGSAGGSTSGL